MITGSFMFMNKRLELLLIIIAVLILIPALTYSIQTNSEIIDNIFKEANTYYENGDYEKALELYLNLEASGIRNHLLFYNIANTYIKLSQTKIGKAILYYKRALYYNNSDSDTIENLNRVRKLVISDNPNKINEQEKSIVYRMVLFINKYLNINTITIILLILLSSANILLIIYFLLIKKHKTILISAIVIYLIFIIILVLFLIKINAEIFTNYGVVTGDVCEAYKEPTTKGKTLFTLSEGIEFEIVEQISDDWALILLPNGIRGYVKTKNIEKIKNLN